MLLYYVYIPTFNNLGKWITVGPFLDGMIEYLYFDTNLTYMHENQMSGHF